jgi:hypothetical protein
VEHLNQKQIDYRISGSNLRLNFTTNLGNSAEESKEGQEVKVVAEVLSVNQHKNCVKFSYRDPVTKVDVTGAQAIQHFMSIRDAENLRMFCDTTYDDTAN